MRFEAFRYLGDENIPPVVDEWLQLRGVDVVSVLDLGFSGSTDAEPQPPFIATAARSQDTVRLRVREVGDG